MKGNRKTPHYRRFRTVAQLIVATLVMVVVVILRKREKYRIDSLLGSSLYERRGEYTPTIETEEKLRHDEDLRSDGGGRIINTQHSNAVHEETAKNERSDSNEAKETELNSPRVVEEHNASQGSRLSQPKGTMPIQELSVIGERNSGTRWTVTHLSECFNHTLLVREKLVRHKHWFQHDVPNGRNRVGTFVVAQFRNPYHWTEAMRKVPHHSPKHYRKDWKSFITTPWTMERLASDLDILKQNMTLGLTADKIACQVRHQ